MAPLAGRACITRSGRPGNHFPGLRVVVTRLRNEPDLAGRCLGPVSRGDGIGQSTRRILRELLPGSGITMIPTAVLEDRCWRALAAGIDGSPLHEAA